MIPNHIDEIILECTETTWVDGGLSKLDSIKNRFMNELKNWGFEAEDFWLDGDFKFHIVTSKYVPLPVLKVLQTTYSKDVSIWVKVRDSLDMKPELL